MFFCMLCFYKLASATKAYDNLQETDILSLKEKLESKETAVTKLWNLT